MGSALSFCQFVKIRYSKKLVPPKYPSSNYAMLQEHRRLTLESHFSPHVHLGDIHLVMEPVKVCDIEGPRVAPETGNNFPHARKSKLRFDKTHARWYFLRKQNH